jgi:hypothetical protein
MPPDEGARLRTLALIRLSYVIGILAFGGVTYALHRQTPPQVGSSDAPGFRIASGVLWLGGLAVVLFVRFLLGKRRSLAERAPLLLAGWAVGEGIALFGAVRYFLFDDPRAYVSGLLFFVLTLVLLPLRRPA